MRPGIDYIGVGVGAMVFDAEGRIFLAQRGPAAKNERGCWEFPGGGVDLGERLEEAICREFIEEYGMVIQIKRLLGIVDHLIPAEGQHWISPTYIASHVSGTPKIVEPDKCSAIGWFTFEQLPEPLSIVTREDLRLYRELHSSHP